MDRLPAVACVRAQLVEVGGRASVVARNGVDHLQLADNRVAVAVAARATATRGSAEPRVLVAGRTTAADGVGRVGVDDDGSALVRRGADLRGTGALPVLVARRVRVAVLVATIPQY